MAQGMLAAAVFLIVSLPMSVHDVRERRVPNALLAPGFLLATWCASRLDGRALLDLSCAAALGFLLFWCLWFLSGGRIGMGDVKYASLIGAFTGVAGLCAAVFTASLAGLVFAVAMIAVDPRNRKAKIPFVPFLSAGAVAALVGRAAGWPDFL